MKYDIKSVTKAAQGKKRIDWADRQMHVLAEIRRRFTNAKPLRGVRVAACLHVTSETAVLMRTLKAGGAVVSLAASNPLSTNDEVAASLVTHDRIPVYAVHGENRARYYSHLRMSLDRKPHITMDDGADLFTDLVKHRKNQLPGVWGSTEETTTGVIRLKSMERRHLLPVPVIAVNDSLTKHLFDNRYGTGQSTIDGILRATNILLAGEVFVVCGYGWCGRGLAMRAKGMGADVIVTEIDPVKALEARMDGFRVMPLMAAARLGKVFVTVTGNTTVITKKHFEVMRDGAIVANSGHFDVEIDLKALAKMSRRSSEARSEVVGFELPGKRTVYVLSDGRLVNLAAAEGHPASVMDMSFANQALAAEYITKHRGRLEPRVYTLPDSIDRQIASLKLKTMGIQFDRLTPKQRAYLDSWSVGT